MPSHRTRRDRVFDNSGELVYVEGWNSGIYFKYNPPVKLDMTASLMIALAEMPRTPAGDLAVYLFVHRYVDCEA